MSDDEPSVLGRVLATFASWPKPVGRPLVIGLAGAQGSGKSTLCAGLEQALSDAGEPCVILGLDDYYLSKSDRLALAQDIHPLFATRGPPCTHDLDALNAALEALSRGETPRLRRFDKATDDVAPESAWPIAPADARVIVLEGWCVGATPQHPAALGSPQNELESQEDPDGRWRAHVNAALAGPYRRLFAKMDRLIMLRPPSFEVVYAWRAQQEAGTAARAKAEGRPAPALMDEHALARFIQHYERITRAMLAEMPARADVTIHLDDHRRSIA